MELPADGHVHSEWSWDALQGSMEGTCRRAVELGLPAVTFTEHVDLTPFRAGSLTESFAPLVADGVLTAPRLDVAGYLASVERCRDRFPDLRVRTGMEVGQPHRHAAELAGLLAEGAVDRVLGSLHCLPDGDVSAEPFTLMVDRLAGDVFREYLAEIPRMVAGSEAFEVLAHLDYPVRSWPQDGPPFDPRDFEDELRQALRAVAAGGRALEINTTLPLHDTVLGWWVDEGGERVTFGSDAHEPEKVGSGLAAAAARARAHGFRPDTRPEAPWFRT
ncbi:histidinol-phosphatase (PHP family) [Friedmanniella luteola]|uniref:Histidinol-phosphatase n=1 Tax=Friedmanniella luteola TaxID=546871 RepID=A0A1H1XZG7_9ACTN|nr:PHP domain-containing protein [Friedmanniella luteola]SDT14560.1 histidinol-phosphatase (PHP family) [Friedmanniella luteola]